MRSTLRTSALAALALAALIPVTARAQKAEKLPSHMLMQEAADQYKADDMAANQPTPKVEHISLNGKVWEINAGDYVIGTDHMLYKTMSPLANGKVQMSHVWTAEWSDKGLSEMPKEDAAAMWKDSNFIAEVEVRDCADLCVGNKVFHQGGAQSAKVDRVFSGGTVTAYRPMMSASGQSLDHVLVMTQAAQVVKEDSFLHRERGVAGQQR